MTPPSPPSGDTGPERPELPRRNDLSVTGPGGWGVQASGRELIFLIVLLAGLAGNAWILREGFRAMVAVNSEARAELRGEFRGIQADHEGLRSSNQSLVCILAVPPEDRPAAFRSGDPCAWILAGAGTPRPGREPGRPPDDGPRRQR